MLCQGYKKMNSTILFALAEDLSHPNDILCPRIRPDLDVVGGVWTAFVALGYEKTSEARRECFKYSIERLTTCWPTWEFWIVVSSPRFLPDNRITRYYGAGPLLKRLGVPRTDILESLQESSEGLRYFAATRFGETHLDIIHELMGLPSAIIFMDGAEAKETVQEVVQKGWRTFPTTPPEEALEIVSARSGLVVAAYGGFDDPDVAIAAIGKRETLQPLIDMEMRQ